MIKIDQVSKNYGALPALKNISLEIKEGQVVGLLGPNGAGKTTLIKILTGYFEPSFGHVAINGYDIVDEREKASQLIGYLPENAPFYPELTVEETLVFAAKLRGFSLARLKERLAKVVTDTNLWPVLTRPMAQLSKGYRQRVGLAAAIIAEPRFLLLDEPTNGLDPAQILAFLQLIRSLAQNSTILLSTHILSQVADCCDRALILLDGEVKADISLADLAADNTFTMVLDPRDFAPPLEAEKCCATLGELPLTREISLEKRADGLLALTLQAAPDYPLAKKLFTIAAQYNWPLRELYRQSPSLGQIFKSLLIGGKGT